MIPKIIHYCWFGGKAIPAEQQKFIQNWQSICPDWEIKLWNEDNFDVTRIEFTHQAYQMGKFAFVSDYVRVWALNTYGGVYLDTDVELKASLNSFLQHQAFSCFETVNIPFTSAVWGSCPQHSLTTKLLKYYESKTYSANEPANTITISKILQQDYGINPLIDSTQIGKDEQHSIHIYSSNYFCLDLPINYASHHFIGSWIDHSKQQSYKDRIHNDYYTAHFLETKLINNKPVLKEISKNISFKSILLIIRYYIKYKFK